MLLILLALVLLAALIFMSRPNTYHRTPELFDAGIKLTRIPDFLTPDACEQIIRLAEGNFSQSGVVIGTELTTSSDRTSSTYFLPREYPLLRGIEEQVATLTNKPVENIEQFQVVKYTPGQEFKPHHDWFGPEYLEVNGNKQRQYTLFVYLNDASEDAGTAFPQLQLSFKPVQGTALYWENCISPYTCHHNSLHQGKPPLSDVKYGLNIWVNFDRVL